jgi:Xaa-Pro dipeptidase
MNLPEIQSAIQEQGLDGWLFFDHHQRDPLAYRVLGLPPGMQVTRRWYYFIPASGEPRGLVNKVEPHALDSLPGSTIAYSRWTEQQDELGKLLAGAKRIAMQYSPRCAVPYVSMVDGGTLELVKGFGVEVVGSADLIQLFEARCSESQLESHLEAGRIMDKIRAAAFGRIADELRAGRTIDEYAIHRFILDQIEANSLVTDHGPIVAVNANASDPHYAPVQGKSRAIQSGDLVLIDMWAKLRSPDSIYYDITWTGFCGRTVPSEIQNVFEIVRDARKAAAAVVKSAMASGRDLRGFEVDDAARQHISGKGFGDYFIHRTGHSIGTEVHGSGANMDNFETHDERKVIPWTCFSIEPGIYLPQFGIRSEVNVFVTDRKAQVTGEEQEQLVMLGAA